MTYNVTLKEKFNYDDFRDNQLNIIKNIIEDKKDVVVIMFTGAGKSLCYQFPAVYTNKVALVISPLISLSNDQSMKMKQLNIPVCCLNSTVRTKSIFKDKILKNKYRLVYVTPEFIINEEEFVKELFGKDLLISVNLDEAHTVSSWSQDFRPAYAALGCIKKWVPNVPIMALTATATLKVQNDIVKIMNLVNPVIIKTTFDRPNLIISLKPKTKEAINDLNPIIVKDEPTIIYCQKRKTTEKVAKILTKNGVKCESYHAGMTTVDRESVHTRFSGGILNCVAATIAFGMGIDITIRKVVHYGIPKDMESYYQEIGRAGRDGKISNCIMFYDISDMQINNYFISQIENTVYRNHMMKLALVMKNYIFSSVCRRKYILEYFGEKYDKDNCGNCDVCMRKNGDVDSNMSNCSYEMSLILRVMNLTGNLYGYCMLVDILRGSKAKKINERFKKFDVYGKCNGYTDKWLKTLITIMVNDKYISEKTGSRNFTLMISPKGVKWLQEYNRDNNIITMMPILKEDVNDKKIIVKKTVVNKKIIVDVVDDDVDVVKNNNVEIIEKSNINIFKCEFCDKTFDSKHGVQYHKNIHCKLNVNSSFCKKNSAKIIVETKQNDDDDDVIVITKEKVNEKINEKVNKKQNEKPIDKTFKLYNDGKTIKEISVLSKLNIKTIENHICKLYDDGYDIDLMKIGFDDKKYNMIIEKINEIGNDDKLKEIRDLLPRNVSYLHIRLAILKRDKK